MHLSPRCGAYARTTGDACRNAAMANGRCFLHGGKNPGPPRGNKHALVHGRYTAEAIANRRADAAAAKIVRAEVRAAVKVANAFVRNQGRRD